METPIALSKINKARTDFVHRNRYMREAYLDIGRPMSAVLTGIAIIQGVDTCMDIGKSHAATTEIQVMQHSHQTELSAYGDLTYARDAYDHNTAVNTAASGVFALMAGGLAFALYRKPSETNPADVTASILAATN